MPRLEDLAEIDPEMYALEKQDRDLDRNCHELASRYLRTRSEQREPVKKELEEAISKHFDVRQEKRELQLRRLEEELERMREALGRRKEARSEIVDRRLSELLGERDALAF